MKIETPITITFTEARVLRMPHLDRGAGYIRIPVGLVTTEGVVFERDVVLDKPSTKKVTRTLTERVTAANGREETRDTTEESTVEVADCQRVAINRKATSPHNLVGVEQFQNLEAYDNAVRATKEDDEIAALEAAGAADGWLMPAGTKGDAR